jgi:hypothetical protein
LCSSNLGYAFPQARAGAYQGAVSCVVWFDRGIRETRPVSVVDQAVIDEQPYAGICRYDLSSVSAGSHVIQWALIYSDGTETTRQVEFPFTKPIPANFDSNIVNVKP